MLHGEIFHDPPLDQGLEVKFLFGKKRIVYEWYYGENYKVSNETGGPYARMEMTFSTMTKFDVVQGPATTTITTAFTHDPHLYVQTEESIDKFKQRAQQRQYRKVEKEEFPIKVSRNGHVMFMKTTEAVRVCTILSEDYPEIRTISKFVFDNAFQGVRSNPKSPRFSGVSEFDYQAPFRISPLTLRKSLHAEGATRTMERLSPTTRGEQTGEQIEEDLPTRELSKIAWRHSTDVEDVADILTPLEKGKNRKDVSDKGSTSSEVRRELNFSNLHLGSSERVGGKRRCGEEREERSQFRRRLSNEEEQLEEVGLWPSKCGQTSGINCETFPMQEAQLRKRGMYEQSADEKKCSVNIEKGCGVIRRLPR